MRRTYRDRVGSVREPALSLNWSSSDLSFSISSASCDWKEPDRNHVPRRIIHSTLGCSSSTTGRHGNQLRSCRACLRPTFSWMESSYCFL